MLLNYFKNTDVDYPIKSSPKNTSDFWGIFIIEKALKHHPRIAFSQSQKRLTG